MVSVLLYNQNMNTEQIKNFLIRANRNGYGNEAIKPTNESDASHTIGYSEPDWQFHDNYFGGEPFGGRELIFYKNKPIWMMVYYGFVSDMTLQNEVYSFLKKALLEFPEDAPYRGPKNLEEGDWQYTNKIIGDFDNFSGEEVITLQGKEVYRAMYQGGLVDK